MSRLRILCWSVLGLALLLRVYLYVMGGEFVPVTTDEALTVLQAKEVLRGEFPVLLTAQPYMFPLEAYWMAPLVTFLPRTAYGMRVLVFLEGLVFLWLVIKVLQRIGTVREVWPGYLLALFPSVYIVMNQFAYSQPHNNSAFILALAAAWFALGISDERTRRNYTFVFLTGFFAVFAFANAMLAVALILPVLIVALFRSHPKRWPVHVPLMAAGGAIGILPYMAAIWRHPGAHQAVSSTRAWADALERFWSPAIKCTLPVTMGITPCLFPDSEERVAWGAGFGRVFPFLFAVLLAGVLIWCLIRMIRQVVNRRWPRMGAPEMFFGITLLSLILFTLSSRADSGAYRYLAPVALSLPFLAAAAFASVKHRAKWIIGIAAAALALFNAVITVALPLKWVDPTFASSVMSAPPLDEAIAFMEEQGIRHCYASHWAAYRINFYTDEDIICSQPYNERFPGWFIPYKAEVDAATNAAYVLTGEIRFLKPHIFERHMRTMGVRSRVHTARHFRVYYDFEEADPRDEVLLDGGDYTLTATSNNELLPLLTDGDDTTRWVSEEHQEPGMFVQLDFDKPVVLSRLKLHYHIYTHDMTERLNVYVLAEGGWKRTHERLRPTLDKFAFKNGHPVYGGSKRTIRFDPVKAQAVKLEVAEPRAGWCWSLTQVDVFAMRTQPLAQHRTSNVERPASK